MELYNELYNAIDQRHTVRDIEDRKVPEEILEKVIVSVFKAPTNDHIAGLAFYHNTASRKLSKKPGRRGRILTSTVIIG